MTTNSWISDLKLIVFAAFLTALACTREAAVPDLVRLKESEAPTQIKPELTLPSVSQQATVPKIERVDEDTGRFTEAAAKILSKGKAVESSSFTLDSSFLVTVQDQIFQVKPVKALETPDVDANVVGSALKIEVLMDEGLEFAVLAASLSEDSVGAGPTRCLALLGSGAGSLTDLDSNDCWSTRMSISKKIEVEPSKSGFVLVLKDEKLIEGLRELPLLQVKVRHPIPLPVIAAALGQDPLPQELLKDLPETLRSPSTEDLVTWISNESESIANGETLVTSPKLEMTELTSAPGPTPVLSPLQKEKLASALDLEANESEPPPSPAVADKDEKPLKNSPLPLPQSAAVEEESFRSESPKNEALANDAPRPQTAVNDQESKIKPSEPVIHDSAETSSADKDDEKDRGMVRDNDQDIVSPSQPNENDRDQDKVVAYQDENKESQNPAIPIGETASKPAAVSPTPAIPVIALATEVEEMGSLPVLVENLILPNIMGDGQAIESAEREEILSETEAWKNIWIKKFKQRVAVYRDKKRSFEDAKKVRNAARAERVKIRLELTRLTSESEKVCSVSKQKRNGSKGMMHKCKEKTAEVARKVDIDRDMTAAIAELKTGLEEEKQGALDSLKLLVEAQNNLKGVDQELTAKGRGKSGTKN